MVVRMGSCEKRLFQVEGEAAYAMSQELEETKNHSGVVILLLLLFYFLR